MRAAIYTSTVRTTNCPPADERDEVSCLQGIQEESACSVFTGDKELEQESKLQLTNQVKVIFIHLHNRYMRILSE